MERNPIQILADVLPKMMQAVLAAPRASGRAENALGGITSAIAGYLNAEISSIFRVDQKRTSLVLTEAHGYDKSVIGEEHAINKGLTGRIFSDRVALVLNYCVQEPKLGWAGKFDTELQSHCWSLLGVPIMSSQETFCHGVLKFENKRSGWATLEHGRYFMTSIPPVECAGEKKRICTPTLIAELIGKMPAHLPRQKEIVDLANQLSREVHRMSYRTPGSNVSIEPLADRVELLTDSYLVGKLSSTKSYAAALQHELDHLPSDSFSDLACLRSLTHALCLALDAYVPFGQDDFHLARALAQIIGMAFDASETARARALEMIRHGIKNVSSAFLGQVDLLYQGARNLPDFKKIEPHVRSVYASALDVTSSCEVASRHPSEGVAPEPDDFGHMYQNDLIDRMEYYRNYSGCNGITFRFPEPENLSPSIRHARMRCDSGLIRGVLDGLVRNAVRHAKPKVIEFRLDATNGNVVLIITDDGKGMSQQRVRKINSSQLAMTLSSSGGFGIVAYRRALAEAGCHLEVQSSLGKGTKVSIHIPILAKRNRNTNRAGRR